MVRSELSDGDGWTIDGERWQDGIETRAIRKSGIDHWTGLVDPSTCEPNHPIDDSDELIVRIKRSREAAHNTV
jgi:hypothetical protein